MGGLSRNTISQWGRRRLKLTTKIALGFFGALGVLAGLTATYALWDTSIVPTSRTADRPVVVFGERPAGKEARPVSSAKLNYPQAAVRAEDGSILIANSLGMSVERVEGDTIRTVVGRIENEAGRISRYSSIVLDGSDDVLVADADAALIYRVNIGSGEHSIFAAAPAVGDQPGDFFFVSSIDRRGDALMAAGAPVRPVSAASVIGIGPTSIYLIENGEWRHLADAPQINGEATRFRTVVVNGDGYAAIAGKYFMLLDAGGAVQSFIDISATHGGGILKREGGWIVGAHTRLLSIDDQLSLIEPIPLLRKVANIGHVSEGENPNELLITDSDSQSVFAFDISTGEMLRQIGNSGVASKVVGMTVAANGNVLMLENATPRLYDYNPFWGWSSVIAGTGAQVASSPKPADEFSFQYPNAVAEGPDGAIYVTEGNYRIVRVFDGDVTVFAGDIYSGKPADGQNRAEARFGNLRGIDVDDQGRVWVVDSGNSTLWRIELDGTLTSIMGTGEAGTWAEGQPAKGQPLRSPYDVVVRDNGTVLISDTLNSVIVEIGADGIARRFAGTQKALTYQGQGDYGGDGGPATEALFNTPRALAEGRDGSVYVMDSFNDRVRRIRADGMIQTVAGGGFGISDDASKLNHATGIAVTGSHLYVADTGNSRVIAIPLSK